MMRKCHLNTCPVGVATQDEKLRKRFTGKPEDIINFFMFVAEEVRELMAKLGFKTFDEMVGQMQTLNMRRAIKHWKAQGLDYSRILAKPEVDDSVGIYQTEIQDHGLDKALDNDLIAEAKDALENQTPVQIKKRFYNYNRTIGAMLSGEVASRYGMKGLADDTIHIKGEGTAGQSFGAWLAQGVTLELAGEANDYVGKGLSGGRIILYPHKTSAIKAANQNMIVGNTLLYGAIKGEAFISGVAGERFCVRNSGATAVIEGIGDHGCEYMTGGVMVCLGSTGRNFAAGMSGGIAYVWDKDGDFARRCNMEMVELESITAGSDASDTEIQADPTQHDDARLKQLIERHKNYTNSAVATDLLNRWDEVRSQFVKVMPTLPSAITCPEPTPSSAVMINESVLRPSA